MRHPSGVGLWAVAIRGVGWPVFVPAHTAHEAWQAAAARLGGAGFGDCTFMLLSDRVSVGAPERPVADPAIAKRVRRKLRAAGAHP